MKRRIFLFSFLVLNIVLFIPKVTANEYDIGVKIGAEFIYAVTRFDEQGLIYLFGENYTINPDSYIPNGANQLGAKGKQVITDVYLSFNDSKEVYIVEFDSWNFIPPDKEFNKTPDEIGIKYYCLKNPDDINTENPVGLNHILDFILSPHYSFLGSINYVNDWRWYWYPNVASGSIYYKKVVDISYCPIYGMEWVYDSDTGWLGSFKIFKRDVCNPPDPEFPSSLGGWTGHLAYKYSLWSPESPQEEESLSKSTPDTIQYGWILILGVVGIVIISIISMTNKE